MDFTTEKLIGYACLAIIGYIILQALLPYAAILVVGAGVYYIVIRKH